MYTKEVKLKTMSIHVKQITKEDLNKRVLFSHEEGVLFQFDGKYPLKLTKFTQIHDGVEQSRYDIHVPNKGVGLYLDLDEAIDSINKQHVNHYLYPSYRFSAYYRRQKYLRTKLERRYTEHKESQTQKEYISKLLGGK